MMTPPTRVYTAVMCLMAPLTLVFICHTVLIAPLVLPAGANVGAGLVVSQQNVSQVNGKPGQ